METKLAQKQGSYREVVKPSSSIIFQNMGYFLSLISKSQF